MNFINMNCMKELVYLKYSGVHVNVSSRREPVCLRCSDGLVTVNSRGSSIWVEG